MSSPDSAPSGQKHCKKQLTFSSSDSISNPSVSNDKVDFPVNKYAVSISKLILNPPESSTMHLPQVSKKIEKTVKMHTKSSYAVTLPNTTKSHPVQMKLGSYFTSIAQNENRMNPSLRPMKYGKSQAMFNLGSRITKAKVQSVSQARTSPPLVPSQSSISKAHSIPSQASPTQTSFWSHPSSASAESQKQHDIILQRDEICSLLLQQTLSSGPPSTSSSSEDSSSMYKPSPNKKFHASSTSKRITRAQRRFSHSPLPSSSSSSIFSLSPADKSSVPPSRDHQAHSSSVSSPTILHAPQHATFSCAHSHNGSGQKDTTSSTHTSASDRLSTPKGIPTVEPPLLHSSNREKLQSMLQELSSHTSELQSLRSEYETRKQFIENTLEELTLSSTYSPLTNQIIFPNQSAVSQPDQDILHLKNPPYQASRSIKSPRCHKFSNLNFEGSAKDPMFTASTNWSCDVSRSSTSDHPIPEEITFTDDKRNDSMNIDPEVPLKSDEPIYPTSSFVDHILDDRFLTQSSSVHSSQASGSIQDALKCEPKPQSSKAPSTTSSIPHQNSDPSEHQQHVLQNHPTICLQVTQEPDCVPIVSPVMSGKLDLPVNKKKDSVRIIAQNCRGAFHSSKQHTDFYIPSMESLQGYAPDIVCLSETNTDWNVRDNGYDVDLMNRAIWSPSPTKTVVASCTWKNLRRTTYQPGGVLTTSLNSMPSRIKTTYRDPYGRYAKIVYQAKGNRSVSLYNVYRPNPGSTSTSGIDTAWMQQWRCLRDKHDPCDPRQICTLHLIADIQKDMEVNIYPIVVGDFNETLTQASKNGIQDLMSSCNLVQVFQETVGFVPSSRHNKRSVFHFFVSKSILKYVLKVGVLPTESGFHTSDHIPFFVDFHYDLFNYKEAPIVPPNIRKLKMYDSPSVEKYVCYIKNQMHHHNILKRFFNLQDYIKVHEFDWTAEQELELLDAQMTQIRLRAENRLCPDPSRFKNASKMNIQVHKIRHLVSIQKFWKKGLDYSHLVRELKSYDLENTDLSSIVKLQERISKERVELKFLHEEEDVVRMDHLDYLHEKAVEIQNKQKASIIKNMKMRETQKRSWSKIRFVTRSSTNRNVERLGIPEGFQNKTTSVIWDYLSTPGVKPKFVYINDPYDIEKRLIEWQYHHYGQAKETPLASPYWHEKLDPLQKSDSEMDEIMTGKIFEDSNLPSEAKDFLHHMTSNIQPVMKPEDYLISDEVFRKFYSKARESTSSSPSGLHLGHWKAGAADKDIRTILSGIIRLSVQNTYTLKRWRKVVSILMEKVRGHPNIHKFRTIHLLESDMNFVLRYIWGRQFMRHNEKNQAWHSNQYGSRKGIQGQSATLNKVLTLDISRYYAEPAAIVDNDAKACYDRMIPVVLSYALIRLGLPKALTRFMCKWLEEATYYIKTSKGVSKFQYCSCLESYLYGTGQGTGWSPPNWGAISDLISTVMGENTPGMKLVHPNRRFYSNRSFDAFVDDVNGGLTSEGLHTFHPSPHSKIPLLQTIYEQIQVNVQYYSRLLFTSGGKLALDKCGIYILEYEWKNGIRKMINTADKYDDIKVDQTFQNNQDTIKILNPNIAGKMLGAYTAPDGNTREQYKVLYEVSAKWGKRISNGYLNKFDVQNSFKLGLIPALQYPLGVGVLSEKQCDSLLVPSMSKLLNKMGVVSTVNREIVHSPILYGGFAMPNLFTIQGYHKVQMMLGHVRKMDTTGDLIVIAIATAQQEIGVSQPILSLPFSDLHMLLSHSWLKEVWRFVSSIAGAFCIHNSWIPPPLYERDINIMDTVMKWDIPEATKIIINTCRLYCKVYFVGELYESNGRRMKYHILHMTGKSYHDDKFPEMQLPRKFKETWSYALHKFSNQYPPASQLGDLLHGKNFQYRMNTDMSAIFKYIKGQRHSMYMHCPAEGKDKSYVEVKHVSTNSNVWNSEDSYAVTVDYDSISLRLRLKHWKPIRILSTSPSVSPSLYRLNQVVNDTSAMEQEKFKQILHSLHPAIVRNTGKIHSITHLRQIALALSKGMLIGVGDASVADQKIGHAYILETKPPQFNLKGVAPVDCVEEDQSSNRGESFTVLAMCTMVHVLCTLYNIEDGSIKIYCDNLEALRRKNPSTSTFTSLSKRDVDVKLSIEHMIENSPVSFSFQHVPGHADDDPDFIYSQATQQVQRNIDMHNLVTSFMKHPPCNFRPTNVTPFLPHQSIALTLHNKVISGDIQNHILMERHGLHMEQRLLKCRGIKHGLQHIVDWQALRLAFKNRDTIGRINATRIIHDLWPTMEKLENRKTGVSNICPRCHKCVENVRHVFQCTARSSQSAFRESMNTFRAQLIKLKTAKPIISAFTELLLAFQQARPPVCPTFQFGDLLKHDILCRVFQNQLQLGKNSFHVGYLSYKWSMAQTLYLSQQNKLVQFDISWSAKVINAIWHFASNIWTKRCCLVHSKNPETSTSLNEEELRASIRTHLRIRRQDLSPTEKSLHLNISANMNRASTITLARWLHLLAEERERTIRLKRTQQILKGGTRPITGYFRRVSSSNRENF